jgi:hypothetical protein
MSTSPAKRLHLNMYTERPRVHDESVNSSRTWLPRCVFVFVLVAGLLTSTGAAATPFHFKEFAQGAIVSWTTCPGTEPPPTPTVCHDYSVWYVRSDGTLGEGAVGPLNRGKEQLQALYEDFEYLLVPDDEDVDISNTYGRTDVAGYFDTTHLTRAGMSAVSIPLFEVDLETGVETPTGKYVELGEFRWTAASPIYRYGNDGPVFDGRQHVSNRCETFNADAHQRFTLGSVTGTVDGVPLSDLATIPQVPDLEPSDAPGGIFNNWFRVVDVSKGCSG